MCSGDGTSFCGSLAIRLWCALMYWPHSGQSPGDRATKALRPQLPSARASRHAAEHVSFLDGLLICLPHSTQQRPLA
jgi:hypothetical protein